MRSAHKQINDLDVATVLTLLFFLLCGVPMTSHKQRQPEQDSKTRSF